MQFHKCYKNGRWAGYDDRILECQKCGCMIGFLDVQETGKEFVVMDESSIQYMDALKSNYGFKKIRVHV
jgi:hypothetical protein